MKIIFLKILIVLNMFVSPSLLANKQVHEHKSKVIPDGKLIPQIRLAVFRDASDGINLHIETQNYRLNSPSDDRPVEMNRLQGHAHLFINGVKKQRVYGAFLHLPRAWFKGGINQIAVSLNSHQHENWVANGQNIVGSIFVDFDKAELVQHHFSSQPMTMGHQHH